GLRDGARAALVLRGVHADRAGVRGVDVREVDPGAGSLGARGDRDAAGGRAGEPVRPADDRRGAGLPALAAGAEVALRAAAAGGEWGDLAVRVERGRCAAAGGDRDPAGVPVPAGA